MDKRWDKQWDGRLQQRSGRARKPSSLPVALLTNGMLRKTLAAARSLGAHRVDVAIGECGRMNPSGWSKYCNLRLRYPKPAPDDDGFTRWLWTESRRHPELVLFPMDDDVMDAVMRRGGALPGNVHALLPPAAAYWRMRDKATATTAAAAFGFRCPASFDGTDEAELLKWAESHTYPLVVKARSLSGSRGLSIACSPDELMAHWRVGKAAGASPFVQQYIEPGERIDVCLLMTPGSHAIAGFIQRELRHFPIPHGPSTAQESMADEDLLRQCRKFAESVGWRGIIEFEFMREGADGELHFMEANTRFWNSLQCSIQAGVDFPWLYYRLSQGWTVKPRFDYSIGIRCRSMLPTDILHYLQPRRKRQGDVSFFADAEVAGHDDILSARDMGPTFGYLVTLAALATRRGTWRDVFHR